MNARLVAFCAFWGAALLASPALAHKPSDSYLTLTVVGARVEGRWDIALRDLDNAMTLDRDGDGMITWGELRSRQADIAGFALNHLALGTEGAPCAAHAEGMEVASHSDGTYAVLRFAAACPEEPRTLVVRYELFFDIDPQHHGIVRIDDGGGTRTAIFPATERRQRFERSYQAPGRQLWSAARLGIRHIFAGIDHLLFLVALLLPSVLKRRADGTLDGTPRIRPALVDVLKTVTAFTVAHSITLTLSALEILRLPSRLVESGIAASVIVAALNNVVPILEDDRWTAAFAFGLLHGFGFSATLMDLGLPRRNLILTLSGFNIGVEIGQLCIVAALWPLAYLARRTRAYRRAVLGGGSIVIAALGALWFVERAFAVKIL